MNLYEVIFTKQPEKFLKKQDSQLATRLITKVKNSLEKDPVPHDAKSLVDTPGGFRIRIGKYRALYIVDHANRRVIVFKLDKRSKAF